MGNNDLTMAYSIDELPGPVPRSRLFRTLIRAVLDGTGELPDGWAVTWRWRNSPKQDMREAPFDEAVTASRAGFLSVMLRRLRRDAGVEDIDDGPREATDEEIEELEEEEEDTFEARRTRTPGQGTRARVLFAKRSDAAVRGWVTRRANIAAAEKAARAKQRAKKRSRR